MFRNILTAASAGAALIAASPLLAEGPGGGHGGGPGGGAGASAGAQMNTQGSMSASPNGMMNASPNSALDRATTTPPTTSTTGTTDFSPNSRALQNSQGPAHASPNGIAHANSNSVLARGAVSSTTLPNLTTGLRVNNTSGTQVGTVSQVITGPNNTIRAVVVTTTSGQTVTLAPSMLSISGNVVTTTNTSLGG